MVSTVDEWFNRMGRSRWMSARNFQYGCAISGVLSAIFFGGSFIVAGFVPPPKAHWSAEQTVSFYRNHETRIHAGSAILTISGMFYLPLSAAISAQMGRIPGLHPVVSTLQLASAAAGIFTWMMPGLILSATAYSLDRPVEITAAMNELFWLTTFMPWPTFIIQNWAYSYAVITDTRPKPLFPKWLAVVNFVSPVLFTPSIGMHTVHSGAVSWAGGAVFWLAGIVFVLQVFMESGCVAFAVHKSPEHEEKMVDLSSDDGHHDSRHSQTEQVGANGV